MDEEETEALKWLAGLIIKYRKRANFVKLVIVIALILVNTSFFVAKLAYVIYTRGWLDAW